MFYRLFILLLIGNLQFANMLQAQKQPNNFSRQVSLQHENDAFALKGTDGYYTSGIFVNYSWLKKNRKSNNQKKIYEVELGQKIYTPGIREVFVVTELDRPITAYLYGSFSGTTFWQNNFLKLSAAIGTIGPAAQGKRVLDLVHPILKIDAEFWDWMFDYGLKNEIGLNTSANYGFTVLKNKLPKLIQLTPVSALNLGTTFTNISQSAVLQIGKLNPINESALFNSGVSDNSLSKQKPEFFVYYRPTLTYQLYNATIQGGLFRSDKGKVTANSEPLVFGNEVGAMVSVNRFSLTAHLNFLTKEASYQQNNHKYGGVNFAVRF